jgi:hypothetical protein
MASFLRWGSAERQSSAQVVGVPEPAVAFHGARAFHDENQPEPSVPRRLSLATLRKSCQRGSVRAPRVQFDARRCDALAISRPDLMVDAPGAARGLRARPEHTPTSRDPWHTPCRFGQLDLAGLDGREGGSPVNAAPGVPRAALRCPEPLDVTPPRRHRRDANAQGRQRYSLSRRWLKSVLRPVP